MEWGVSDRSGWLGTSSVDEHSSTESVFASDGILIGDDISNGGARGDRARGGVNNGPLLNLLGWGIKVVGVGMFSSFFSNVGDDRGVVLIGMRLWDRIPSRSFCNRTFPLESNRTMTNCCWSFSETWLPSLKTARNVESSVHRAKVIEKVRTTFFPPSNYIITQKICANTCHMSWKEERKEAFMSHTWDWLRTDRSIRWVLVECREI